MVLRFYLYFYPIVLYIIFLIDIKFVCMRKIIEKLYKKWQILSLIKNKNSLKDNYIII